MTFVGRYAKTPKSPLGLTEDVISFKENATGKDQRHLAFFAQLSKVLCYDPPSNKAEQRFIRETLTRIGFSQDGSFDFSSLSAGQRAAILDGQDAGHIEVQAFIPKRGEKVGTAVFTSRKAGNYGDNWCYAPRWCLRERYIPPRKSVATPIYSPTRLVPHSPVRKPTR
ncbi:MAG: hypothetical protein WA996_18875 [Candidatus Promineifilaceae bacterium]